VGSDGTIASAEGVEGNPLLLAAAVANVKTWKLAGGTG